MPVRVEPDAIVGCYVAPDVIRRIYVGADLIDDFSGGASGGVVVAINCGGGAFTAEDGTEYEADATNDYWTNQTDNKFLTVDAISGTADDTLYQSLRYDGGGDGNFSYDIPISNGTYNVTLKFAEIFYTAVGARIFDVSIEGVLVIDDLDIFAQVGHDAAHDVTINGVEVSDGELNIVFASSVDAPQINAILVETGGELTEIGEPFGDGTLFVDGTGWVA